MIQEHGGNIYGYGDILDFSSNINPLGPPESVRAAYLASAETMDRYPDSSCTELRSKLSLHFGLPAENIVCGNGAADLIYRSVHALRPKSALLCRPCFGEYEKALAETECRISEYFLRESEGFILGEDFLSAVSNGYDMVILCSPNNPTGRLIPPHILETTAEICRDNGTVLICDECFMGFTGLASTHSLTNFMNDNCIVLGAFTKLYAMAGLRLGYMLCGNASTAEKIAGSGQYWSVSSPAQAAGIAALDELDYVERTIELIRREREFLTNELTALGLKVCPSDADFLLFRFETELYDLMLTKGILIRRCDSFRGLDSSYYRIAVKNHKDNSRFIDTLRRCLNG